MTARKARPYGLDNKQMEQLWQVAIKAFLLLEDFGEGRVYSHLSPKVEELDSYLANDIDEKLWLKMQEYVESKVQPQP